VPLYRDMLSETLDRVFHFPCHSIAIASTNSSSGFNSCHCANRGSKVPLPGPIDLYRQEFDLVLSYIKENQERIDRLTNAVTAVISIRDSERAMSDNRNLGRLTWLATFFLPFSLIATMFCTQVNVTPMTMQTVKWYFAVSLPLAAVITSLAVVLS
jgi:CorA-like Mg2+ transporter protein